MGSVGVSQQLTPRLWEGVKWGMAQKDGGRPAAIGAVAARNTDDRPEAPAAG
jgi:hypothetical protein